MAVVFRVEKRQGYTIMSNHHLRNAELTLKAKGLLSQMLSLPENWDYTLKGLSHINRESIDAIRTAVWELERAGYITRKQGRDEKGKMTPIEYTIFEQPQETAAQEAKPDEPCPVLENPTPAKASNPLLDFPTTDNPIPDNPTTGKPTSENPTQLNKDISKKEKINTDVSNTHQSIYPAQPEDAPPFGGIDRIDGNSAVEIYRDIIKDNIEYEALCCQFDRERVNEIVELILETVCSTAKYIKVGGEKYPAELVKSRLMKMGQFHVEYVFNRIDNNTTKIYNIRAYMLKTLFSAPSTMGHFYTAEVNHDMYGGGYQERKYTYDPETSL
ncbi:MAG: DUF6017 domain-containing protein [Candidatus Gastranaerophilaceae bacterium]|nr:DUF6017 domain-containing protein [Christensenellales bacterium]